MGGEGGGHAHAVPTTDDRKATNSTTRERICLTSGGVGERKIFLLLLVLLLAHSGLLGGLSGYGT